jgi:hypothetical protein
VRTYHILGYCSTSKDIIHTKNIVIFLDLENTIRARVAEEVKKRQIKVKRRRSLQNIF